MCGICVQGLVPPRWTSRFVGGREDFPSGSGYHQAASASALPQRSYAIVRICRPSSLHSPLSPPPVQAQRFMEEYRSPRIIPPEVAKMGGVTSEMARRCAPGKEGGGGLGERRWPEEMR